MVVNFYPELLGNIVLDLEKIKFTPSPNKGPRNSKVQYIVLHSTEGAWPGCLTWMKNSKSRASAHYVISKTGELVCLVKPEEKSWSVVRANPFTLNIEHEGFCDKKGWVTKPMWEKSVQLSAALCKEFNLSPDKIISHSDDFLKQFGNNHHDVGQYFDLILYRADVQAVLDIG